MIHKSIGLTHVFICEDTAHCAIKNIVEDTVQQVADFVDSMNYVVTYIAGSNNAAEKLKYYTAGNIIDLQDIDLYIGDFS